MSFLRSKWSTKDFLQSSAWSNKDFPQSSPCSTKDFCLTKWSGRDVHGVPLHHGTVQAVGRRSWTHSLQKVVVCLPESLDSASVVLMNDDLMRMSVYPVSGRPKKLASSA